MARSSISPEALPRLESEHGFDIALVDAFRRDGHVLVRGLATRDEVQNYRPVIAAVVEEVARQHDSQGRIDDYSKLFTQVTNIWRLSTPRIQLARIIHVSSRAIARDLWSVGGARSTFFAPPALHRFLATLGMTHCYTVPRLMNHPG